MNTQAPREGQQTPSEAIGHSKGRKVDSFAIPHFSDLSSSPTTLASHLCSLSSFTTTHPKPTHHLPLHPPLRLPCSQILPTATLTTSLPPLLNGHLERGHHSEMLLRVTVSSTLKSLLRYDKSLGISVLKQSDTSPGKPKHHCSLQSGHRGRNARSHKQHKVSSEDKMGLLGTTQGLLLPGNTTREKGAQAAASAGQVPGPCIDDCRCNNSIFISGVMPPISYSNYHSTLTADSTPQLVPDQCHAAGNKLNFLPTETITSFNSECEP